MTKGGERGSQFDDAHISDTGKFPLVPNSFDWIHWRLNTVTIEYTEDWIPLIHTSRGQVEFFSTYPAWVRSLGVALKLIPSPTAPGAVRGQKTRAGEGTNLYVRGVHLHVRVVTRVKNSAARIYDFSRNLVEYFILIGYATRYLFVDR